MRLLMAAGGTGGHVIPALVVAKASKERDPSTDVLFVGTPRGFENKLVPAAGFPLELMKVRGLKGLGYFRKLSNLLFLPEAFWRSWKLLKMFSPDVVFGIGGYASGPILLVAALGGWKTAILEPNATPGFSNRLLSKFVHRVFVAFEEAASFFPASKCQVTGNPIRKEILNVPPPDFRTEEKTLLVFGGSQGARVLNRAVVEAFTRLGLSSLNVKIIHQTGKADIEEVREKYRDAKIEAEVEPFFEDMALAYERSHLVLARGGSSILEIAACGRPSVLVPYPYAADDHQTMNARRFEKEGAAILIKNQDCTGEKLAQTLRSLLENPEKLEKMSQSALQLRKDNAAQRIVEEMSALSKRRKAEAA